MKQRLHPKREEESENKSTSRPTVPAVPRTKGEPEREPFCTTMCHLQARPRVGSPGPPHFLQTADSGPGETQVPKGVHATRAASEHVALESSHAFRSYANSVATQ